MLRQHTLSRGFATFLALVMLVTLLGSLVAHARPLWNIRELAPPHCTARDVHPVVDLRRAPAPSSCAPQPILLFDAWPLYPQLPLPQLLEILQSRAAAFLLSATDARELPAVTLGSLLRSGHAVIMRSRAATLAELRAELAMFESSLGTVPPFVLTTLPRNVSLPLLRVIGAMEAEGGNVLRGENALRWVRTAPQCDKNSGLVGWLDKAQLECLHERLACDFIAPGELLYRFCADVCERYQREVGIRLGRFAARGDASADAGESELSGFVESNRARIAMAFEVASGVDAVDRTLAVLYGLSHTEVNQVVDKKARRDTVLRHAGALYETNLRFVGVSASLTRLVLGVAGLACALYGMIGIAVGWKSRAETFEEWLQSSERGRWGGKLLLDRVADFGKSV